MRSPGLLAPDVHLAHLDRSAAGFAAVLDRADLAAPVPGCAPWTLLDLAHHLGGVHRWATGAVTGDRVPDEYPDAPRDRAGLLAWFRTGVHGLSAALRAADPDAPAWTIAPPPTAGFWIRRQAHETAVHAWDAGRAAGTPGSPPADLAGDGIDEVVGTLLPRQLRLGRIPPLPTAVALEPVEGGRWVLGDDPSPVATVAGPAGALLLLLWHRVPLDDPRLTVRGDRAAAREVLATALTP